MGSGYHSRSPEELRQYLDSLNLKSKKKPLMQYIILANIIGIMFVLFVIFQDQNLSSTFKPSNKIQVEELEAYFTRSNESSPESTSYFLFVKNTTTADNAFPKADMRVVLTLTTEEKEECLQKKYDLPVKKIAPKSTEFFSLLIEESEIKKTTTCDTFFHRKKKKAFTELFTKGNSKFTPDLNLIYKDQIYRMSIPN